jgi:hypothetical protein
MSGKCEQEINLHCVFKCLVIEIVRVFAISDISKSFNLCHLRLPKTNEKLKTLKFSIKSRTHENMHHFKTNQSIIKKRYKLFNNFHCKFQFKKEHNSEVSLIYFSVKKNRKKIEKKNKKL